MPEETIPTSIIGTKFVVVYEVIRPAETGEMAPSYSCDKSYDGELVSIDNSRKNKWWARPVGPLKQQEVLACFEPANDILLSQKLAEFAEFLIQCRTYPAFPNEPK